MALETASHEILIDVLSPTATTLPGPVVSAVALASLELALVPAAFLARTR